jgi:hypothetical protein
MTQQDLINELWLNRLSIQKESQDLTLARCEQLMQMGAKSLMPYKPTAGTGEVFQLAISGFLTDEGKIIFQGGEIGDISHISLSEEQKAAIASLSQKACVYWFPIKSDKHRAKSSFYDNVGTKSITSTHLVETVGGAEIHFEKSLEAAEQTILSLSTRKATVIFADLGGRLLSASLERRLDTETADVLRSI